MMTHGTAMTAKLASPLGEIIDANVNRNIAKVLTAVAFENVFDLGNQSEIPRCEVWSSLQLCCVRIIRIDYSAMGASRKRNLLVC